MKNNKTIKSLRDFSQKENSFKSKIKTIKLVSLDLDFNYGKPCLDLVQL